MIFVDLVAGNSVFLDANTLVYHFQPHPRFGPACTDLVERIEHQELLGFTSTHVLSEMAHRLMTLEACARFGWRFTGIAPRLRKHFTKVQTLTRFRQAIQEVPRVRHPGSDNSSTPDRRGGSGQPATRPSQQRRPDCRHHASERLDQPGEQ